MDEIFSRFVSQAPVAVLARAAMGRVFSATHLDELFGRAAATQYTRSLTFGTLFRLMTKVTLRTHDSVHAAYRPTSGIPVSLTAVYDKLGGLETGTSESFGSRNRQDHGRDHRGPTSAAPGPHSGFASAHSGRQLPGRNRSPLGLPTGGRGGRPAGMSLVVRDGRTGLLTDMIACEDAYTGERSLFPRLLALVRPDDLWLATVTSAPRLHEWHRRGEGLLPGPTPCRQ